MAGIEEVMGDLILDDTLFDREFIAPGWPEDQLNQAYCAAVSSLSIMENLLWVEVTPGSRSGSVARLDLFPPDCPFTLEGNVLTTSNKKENLITLFRPEPDGTIRVKGRTYIGNSPSRFSVSVRNPTLYFGSLFNKALKRASVTVKGSVRMAQERPNYQSKEVLLLGTITSDLTEAITVTNKMSLNHSAELLFKLAGWKVAGKGTFSTGELAARKLFEGLKIEDADPFTMKDGSGLSRGNTFSAHTLVSLLAAIYRSSIRDAYLRSLPIAGVDGSLKRRLTQEPYRSRVRGKTGWIREVSTLSGYAQAVSGEVFAFSILFNGYKGRNATMKSIQDTICRAIVDG
jgi:PBP4 family serine-type D-alanyl-D-alanine carboxypeptidase